MRKYWICAVLLAFVFGIAIDRVVQRLQRNSALAGIEKLHQLDQRVTILNDMKANLEVFTNHAVLIQNGALDVGKQAIYASAVRSRADAPGYTITSYKPDIQEVRVVAADWAFEWGLFAAAAHPSADKPVVPIHGKVLRILHRESNGDWKFLHVMVVASWDQWAPGRITRYRKLESRQEP